VEDSLREQESDVDEIDVEEYAKQGKDKPRAARYVVRIDKTKYTVTEAVTTGRNLLALAGKTPETHKLYQHQPGHQPALVGPDQEVDLRAPGVERFTTMPKDTTEGEVAVILRREFRLPPEEESCLDSLGLGWEAVKDDNSTWLLVHGWAVPPGYNYAAVSLALLIPPSYPDAPLDMVYFRPGLARADGRPIGALAEQAICGQPWQRWSRHRTPHNPWRVGVDEISSHLTLVDEWLRRELEQR
jgi:hypothetical protein